MSANLNLSIKKYKHMSKTTLRAKCDGCDGNWNACLSVQFQQNIMRRCKDLICTLMSIMNTPRTLYDALNNQNTSRYLVDEYSFKILCFILLKINVI